MKGKKKVEFSLDAITGNPVTKGQLEGFIEEIYLGKQKVATENEAIKDIRNEAKDSLGIPGKVLMRLVRERQQPGSLEAEVHQLEEIQAISEAMDGQPTP